MATRWGWESSRRWVRDGTLLTLILRFCKGKLEAHTRQDEVQGLARWAAEHSGVEGEVDADDSVMSNFALQTKLQSTAATNSVPGTGGIGSPAKFAVSTCAGGATSGIKENGMLAKNVLLFSLYIASELQQM
eukprot:4919648-Amphidinium_carterae.1